ncbi:MAG: thioredoxin domain-containing protein, partial [Clostridiales bacterium]|nr:thioredoxin domain-containing protein [Clostridiales bacterium]
MSIINMNSENYENYINGSKPVLAEFSAPWCSYCRRLAPAFEAAAEKYSHDLIFGVINIDDEPELARKEQIEVIPTLLIYQNEQVLGSIVAPESRAQLEAFIEETLPQGENSSEDETRIYDMIIVGGGPGGYTAALYGARAGLDTIVLEKLSAGGQMALTEQIDNYPGFEDGRDG